jgi:hypothetical protein
VLGDFSAKVDKGDFSKPTIGDENLHEVSNDNEFSGILCRILKSECQECNVSAYKT